MLHPAAAFDALDRQSLRLEYSTKVPYDERGQVYLTMRLEVATQVLERVRARGASTESADVLMVCAAAAKNLIAAIDDALDFAARAPASFTPKPPARHA